MHISILDFPWERKSKIPFHGECQNADRAMDKLKEENQELQMKIVQLETEMKNHRKN